MIVSPQNDYEFQTMSNFLRAKAHLEVSPHLRMIGWVEKDRLRIVCGLDGFFGKTCQIHIAFDDDYHYSPKQMLKVVFHYAFVTCERTLLIGLVNSHNTKAVHFDTHLGFKELLVLPGVHDGGGNLIIMGMWRHECRFLERSPHIAEAGHA